MIYCLGGARLGSGAARRPQKGGSGKGRSGEKTPCGDFKVTFK